MVSIEGLTVIQYNPINKQDQDCSEEEVGYGGSYDPSYPDEPKNGK
jgi:hypothetical protein